MAEFTDTPMVAATSGTDSSRKYRRATASRWRGARARSASSRWSDSWPGQRPRPPCGGRPGPGPGSDWRGPSTPARGCGTSAPIPSSRGQAPGSSWVPVSSPVPASASSRPPVAPDVPGGGGWSASAVSGWEVVRGPCWSRSSCWPAGGLARRGRRWASVAAVLLPAAALVALVVREPVPHDPVLSILGLLVMVGLETAGVSVLFRGWTTRIETDVDGEPITPPAARVPLPRRGLRAPRRDRAPSR